MRPWRDEHVDFLKKRGFLGGERCGACSCLYTGCRSVSVCVWLLHSYQWSLRCFLMRPADFSKSHLRHTHLLFSDDTTWYSSTSFLGTGVKFCHVLEAG